MLNRLMLETDSIEHTSEEQVSITPSDPRHSTRDKQKPDRYGYVLATMSNEQKDPISVVEVKSSPD